MNWQKIRQTTAWISFILFPLTLNFFSPYVSIDGAMVGIISGSLIVFGCFFVFGLFIGRAWCSYGCPWAAPSEYLQKINGRTVNRKTTRIIRYVIFTIWLFFLIFGFMMAGGIKGIDPLHMTERYVSIDEPMKFITYYGVVFLLMATTVFVGRRGACHTICWMSPFMVFGMKVSDWLHLPRLKVRATPETCISCNQCTKVCPMSIDVMQQVKNKEIGSTDCILCGACVQSCPKDVLSISFKNKK